MNRQNYSVMLESFSYSGWIVIEWGQYWSHSEAITTMNRMINTWNKQVGRVWVTYSDNEHKLTSIPTMAQYNISHRQS